MEIKLAGTVNDSIVDGPGIRFTVFVQGCPHNCPGCHNPQTHDFSGGTVGDTDELMKKILSNPLLDGVTFSGGEPFCQAEALLTLGKQIKENGLNLMAYTGYTLEYLLEKGTQVQKDLFALCDYVVDGPFIMEQKSYLLLFKGSANQRILKGFESITKKEPVLAEI